MQAYRDRYVEVQESEAQVLGISTDSVKRQAAFRAALGAPFPFVADPTAALTLLFQNKVPFLKMARRTTFVVAQDGRILSIDRGRKAMDPNAAISATASC